jgi:hypothetical protein
MTPVEESMARIAAIEAQINRLHRRKRAQSIVYLACFALAAGCILLRPILHALGYLK